MDEQNETTSVIVVDPCFGRKPKHDALSKYIFRVFRGLQRKCQQRSVYRGNGYMYIDNQPAIKSLYQSRSAIMTLQGSQDDIMVILTTKLSY